MLKTTSESPVRWRTRLRERMAQLGLSASDVNRRAGRSSTFAHHVLSGRNSSPRIDAFADLASALDMTLDDLYFGPIKAGEQTSGGPPLRSNVIPSSAAEQSDRSLRSLPRSRGTGRPNRIEELRKAIGLSQAVLAERIGATQTEIHCLETGKRKLTLEWMAKVAAGLGVPVWELLPERPSARHSQGSVKALDDIAAIVKVGHPLETTVRLIKLVLSSEGKL